MFVLSVPEFPLGGGGRGMCVCVPNFILAN